MQFFLQYSTIAAIDKKLPLSFLSIARVNSMPVLKKDRSRQAETAATPRSSEFFSKDGLDGEMANAMIMLERQWTDLSAYAQEQPTSYPDCNGFVAGMAGRAGTMSLDAIRMSVLPREKAKRIERAFFWVDYDDFLSAVIGVKEDFTVMGFDLRVKPEESSNVEAILSTRKSKPAAEPLPPDQPELSDEERARLIERGAFQLFLSRVSRKWDFESIVRDLLHDWFICDSMILYWRVAVDTNAAMSGDSSTPPEENSIEELTPGIEQVMALCPKDVEWNPDAGDDRLFYRLPTALLEKIKSILNFVDKKLKADAIKYLIEEEGIPVHWIEAVSKGRTLVELRHEDGDHWIVITKSRKHWGLSDPTMKSIFPYMEIRKAVREGDFATSYMMKHFIFHVTMGESIENGPLAGQRTNWATPQDTQKMYETVTRTTKTARLVTNHTVKFNWVFPPKEMWDDSKYTKSEFAILNWSGLTMVIMTGQGATNSSGYISTKRLLATMIYARRRVRHLLTSFFEHVTIKSRLKVPVPDDMIVTAAFDENLLKEPRQLLDELKFLSQDGSVDPLTTQKELGRDPDSIRVNKLVALADNESTGAYKPINPQGFGFGQDQGGRPANPGTVQDEDTRNQPATLK